MFKLIFRNTFRNRLRTVLTVLAVGVAVLSFGLLRTVMAAWDARVNASSPYRLVTRNAVSVAAPLPLTYRERIEKIAGVQSVSYANWFGGYYRDPRSFFANYAVEPKTYLDLYPEYQMEEGERHAFLGERKACIAGRKLAEKFGWQRGDRVILKSTLFPGEWEFVLRGIYRGRDETVDEMQLFFHWAYRYERLKESLPYRADKVGIYLIGLADPKQAAAVSRAVDALFRNSPAETFTETEKAFQLDFFFMSEVLMTVIELISYVVIIIMLTVVGNSITMTTKERTREYAVLRAIGFGSHHLAALVFCESLLISIAGCCAGLLFINPAARIFGHAVGSYFPVFPVTLGTIVLCIAASLAVGVVAALAPACRSIRLRPADGLRMAV